MLAKLRNYWLYPKYIFEQAFYRLILLIQKNEKINILSVPFIILNFPPCSGAKKGSHEWHFDHFINIFWVNGAFNLSHSFSKNSLALKSVSFKYWNKFNVIFLSKLSIISNSSKHIWVSIINILCYYGCLIL